LANVVGLFVMAVGLGLAAAPWWSATLGRDDYPLVWVLGALFGGIGLYAALPGDRLPRLRAFAFVLFLGAFGVVCAALALAPSAPGPTAPTPSAVSWVFAACRFRGGHASSPAPSRSCSWDWR